MRSAHQTGKPFSTRKKQDDSKYHLGKRRVREEARVVLVDGDEYIISSFKRLLRKDGWKQIHLHQACDLAIEEVSSHPAAILIVSSDLGRDNSGEVFILDARLKGFSGYGIIVTDYWSLDCAISAHLSKANDIWLCGQTLDASLELEWALQRQARKPASYKNTSDMRAFGELATEIGCLRTLGLSGFEQRVIRCWFGCFQTSDDLAGEMGCSATAVRKSFSAIYEKTSTKGKAQLAMLLTVLAHMGLQSRAETNSSLSDTSRAG